MEPPRAETDCVERPLMVISPAFEAKFCWPILSSPVTVFETFTPFRVAVCVDVPLMTISVELGVGKVAKADDANKAKAKIESFFMINPLKKRLNRFKNSRTSCCSTVLGSFDEIRCDASKTYSSHRFCFHLVLVSVLHGGVSIPRCIYQKYRVLLPKNMHTFLCT